MVISKINTTKSKKNKATKKPNIIIEEDNEIKNDVIHSETKLIDNFINLKLSTISKSKPVKKNKKIHFNNPEFVILNKPYRSKNSNMPLKSILKKI